MALEMRRWSSDPIAIIVFRLEGLLVAQSMGTLIALHLRLHGVAVLDANHIQLVEVVFDFNRIAPQSSRQQVAQWHEEVSNPLAEQLRV